MDCRLLNHRLLCSESLREAVSEDMSCQPLMLVQGLRRTQTILALEAVVMVRSAGLVGRCLLSWPRLPPPKKKASAVLFMSISCSKPFEFGSLSSQERMPDPSEDIKNYLGDKGRG